MTSLRTGILAAALLAPLTFAVTSDALAQDSYSHRPGGGPGGGPGRPGHGAPLPIVGAGLPLLAAAGLYYAFRNRSRD
mgnify:CR=1 FL=1